MKRALKSHLLLFFLLLQGALCYGQTIQNLKLPRDYARNTLDQVLDTIGKDLNIRFRYEKEYLSRYEISFHPSWGVVKGESKVRNLGDVLKVLRDSWDILTVIGDDGYIYIAQNEEQFQELKGIDSSRENRLSLPNEGEASDNVQLIREQSKPMKRNFALTGELFDKSSGERIPFATVAVSHTTKGTVTDANGRFSIEGVPADTCVLSVQYLGYQSKLIALEPTRENAPLKIEIEPQPMTIAEVFIVGRKDDKALQQYTGEHKMKMAPEALKLLPNIGEKDILRGFQLMPGVSASNESSSGMYVRGGTPDQNLILYDGFTVYYVDHLYGFYSAFNSNAIKDVQLYKGGFEAKYGGRLSSVTEITAKDGNKNKFTIGGEVSLLSVNAYTEIPIGDKITSMFAFRRSYQGFMWNRISGQNSSQSGVDEVDRPVRPGMDTKSSPAYFYDLNGKITVTPTAKDIISLSFFNGTDYIDNTPQFSFGGGRPGGDGGGLGYVTMDNSDFAQYGNWGASARWSRKMNGKLSVTNLISFSNFQATRDQRRSLTVTNDDETETIKSGNLEENNLLDYSFKSDWRYAFNDKHQLEFGAAATQYAIAYSYSQNSDEEKLLDKQNNALLTSLYVQDQISFNGNRLVVTLGVRVNYFSETKKPYFEPRLGASYRLQSDLTLNAATGLFYQYANRVVREDILAGNTDFWILSDGKDIPVSSSAHVNLGLNYDLPNYLLSVEGYYKRNANITEYTLRYKQNSMHRPGGNGDNDEASVSENFYVGNGYATGIEFLAQKKAGRLSGWVSYSIGQVKNRFLEQSDNYYWANQDATHELKLVGIYKLGNFDFSATWIFSTGRPYTAPIGAYQITSPSGVTETFFAVSDKNTFRLPDYHRMDFSANYRFNLFEFKGKQNAISFSLFNAYNRKNVSAKQFQVVDSSILESNINYLSITPNVSFSFKF